jgi:two-component system copper resistance phosphate regulon response regulator CusR
MAILIAEPDEAEARSILQGLGAEGFPCERVATGSLALSHAPDCKALVAEVFLPDLTGFDLAEQLRERGLSTPLILISATCSPEYRVRGLEAGADDFLCKPFALPELAARLRALLRRCRMAPPSRRIEVGDLAWEPELRRVSRGGQRLDLTPKEYALLALLLEKAGQVVSREEVAQALWGVGRERPELRSPNAMDAQVRRLRAKVDSPFDRPLVHTRRGLGLILEAR